jgi:hypothetical protein
VSEMDDEGRSMTGLTLDEFLSPVEAARLLGHSSRWVRELCDSGELVGIRLPMGRRLVARAAVERRLLERGRAAGHPGQPTTEELVRRIAEHHAHAAQETEPVGPRKAA